MHEHLRLLHGNLHIKTAINMFTVPLIFRFWFMVAAYVIHVIDESLLGGSFGK
jgi:hypothetical protein